MLGFQSAAALALTTSLFTYIPVTRAVLHVCEVSMLWNVFLCHPWAARYNTWLLIKLTPSLFFFFSFYATMSVLTGLAVAVKLSEQQHGTTCPLNSCQPAGGVSLSMLCSVFNNNQLHTLHLLQCCECRLPLFV